MSSIYTLLAQADVWTLSALAGALFVGAHLFWFLADANGIRSVPGPWLAKLSHLWLAKVMHGGHRSMVMHEKHKQYGTFVRVAPNHVSVSDPAAMQSIYGHSQNTLKSSFYDGFVAPGLHRGVFNTRNRAEHARKRKMVSHIFAQKSVVEFEPRVHEHLEMLVSQWDRLYDLALKGQKGKDGQGWWGQNGRLWLDLLPWNNYLAFDIIGDLAFGSPFGMTAAGKDSAQAAVSLADAMASYDKEIVSYATVEVPAIETISARGEFNPFIGVLPAWWRPIVRRLPGFRQGAHAVNMLSGIAVVAVAKRYANPNDRVDLLSKLMEGRDDTGKQMGNAELTAEALTQLIAGSDTTSNSLCAILYHLARNPEVQRDLQKELDAALGDDDEVGVSYNQVKSLPFLEAVINETLRVHSTSGIGLARDVPEGGLTVSGRFFPAGTTLSVPVYTVHRDESIWGAEPDLFRPSRWAKMDHATIQSGFFPFSFGPRACVGRNLAMLELTIIIASLVRRYDFVLEDPTEELKTTEGFLRKPLGCIAGIKRRDHAA